MYEGMLERRLESKGLLGKRGEGGPDLGKIRGELLIIRLTGAEIRLATKASPA